MKRLIVLTLSATLLASLSGCSILGNRGVQSCDTTSSAPSRLSRLNLSNLIPWRRGATEECETCNEGFSETGFVDRGIVDGGYINSGFSGNVIQGSTIPQESLYHPEVVYEGPAMQSAPVVTNSPIETIATPPYR